MHITVVSTKVTQSAHYAPYFCNIHCFLFHTISAQVSRFIYLSCQLSYKGEVEDDNHKFEKFNYMCVAQ